MAPSCQLPSLDRWGLQCLIRWSEAVLEAWASQGLREQQGLARSAQNKIPMELPHSRLPDAPRRNKECLSITQQIRTTVGYTLPNGHVCSTLRWTVTSRLIPATEVVLFPVSNTSPAHKAFPTQNPGQRIEHLLPEWLSDFWTGLVAPCRLTGCAVSSFFNFWAFILRYSAFLYEV